MSQFEHWGHYSQMMWQSTDSVGCAIQYCAEGLGNSDVGISPWFLVCNYWPAGKLRSRCICMRLADGRYR